MSDPRSMGDLFMQRRAAAAGGSRGTAPGSSGSSAGGGGGEAPKKKSFADIQREQMQQQQQQKQGGGVRQDGGGGRPGAGTQRQQPQRGGQRGGPPNQPPVDEYGRLSRPQGSHRRGGGRSGHQSNSRASLPLEQGAVHTLLDKFGFLLCADRNAELFFHYSEYKSGHSDELNIGDEVEFRVGRSEDRGGGRRGGGSSSVSEGDKLCALDVRILPKGTIEWETEDMPGKRWRGSVERAVREEHRGGGGGRGRPSDRTPPEGSIRVLLDDDTAGDGEANEGAAPPVEVCYTPSDYKDRRPGHSRLDRKDVVEFALVTERRTGKKYARNISLVRSERDRQREAREAKLLEGATLERGRVVSDRGEYGFLRSTARREEVYFHVSHLIDDGEDGAGDGKKKDETTKEGKERKDSGAVFGGTDVRAASILREGQDVEFYVVDEGGGGGGGGGGGRGGGGRGGSRGGGGKGLSARKIKRLPPGSVQFERTVATGVTGIVLDCPVGPASSAFGRRDGPDRRAEAKAANKVGRVRLEAPIIDNDEGGPAVTDVVLRPEAYPGGTFAAGRTGDVGIWIRPGDVLLFDVVKQVVDGTCHAVSTKCLRRKGGSAEKEEEEESTKAKPSVKLVELSPCGRAEGVVKEVRDNYGFIHVADRSTDLYFNLSEVMPGEIQGDLARNSPSVLEGDGVQSKAGRINVEAGMEVSFDISLQATPSGGGDRGGRYGRQSNIRGGEKETLRARRVQVLPKGSVVDEIPLASGAKATVAKVDQRHPFVGTLELDEPVKFDHLACRYPLITKLVDDVSKGKYGEDGVTFHDAIGENDSRFVTSVVNTREDLEWCYVPEDATDPCKRRLRIFKKKEGEVEDGDATEKAGQDGEGSEPAAAEPPADGASATTPEELDGSNGGNADKAGSGVEESADASNSPAKRQGSHKKGKKNKTIRTVRFDKSSFDISDGPLGNGDVVTGDLFVSRRSGAIIVENITVLERKERPPVVVSDGEEGKESQRQGLTGVVTEIVQTRQFGFITAVDEEGARGEHVFFHFKEVESPQSGATGEDAAQDGNAPPSSLSVAASARGKKSARGDNIAITKGDEVKFDMGRGKNGKLCATSVSILPRGTLKLPKTDNNSPTCTGYVLMEPSHTSLGNTPSHTVVQSSAPGGTGSRWDNVRGDKSSASKSGSNVKEDGIILLLTDPSHLFTPKPKKSMDSTAGETADGAAEKDAGAGDESNAKSAAEATEDNQSLPTVLGTHIRYKLSSLAARGTGASSRSEPRRGDLVTFGKTRGAKIVKEIRIEKAAAATNVKGVLTELDKENDTATFVSSDNEADKYKIQLTEVVSCDKSLLKDKEQVDGILHEGKIFGVCRTKDIFLSSSMGKFSSGGSSGGLKERPRLNLTVKKELQGMGGQIMAQSRMAKGPDGTNGFIPGWTKRVSPYAKVEEEEEAKDGEEDHDFSLSPAANEFVPNFSVSGSSVESSGE